MTTSFAWSPANGKFLATDNDANVYSYDAGVELNAVREITWMWQFKPFLGVGVGGRTYDYHSAAINPNTCLAGYGTVGLELQYGATAVRGEARDYAFCFEDPLTHVSHTRNDIGLSLGVAYHIR